jgi:hypothetical protein
MLDLREPSLAPDTGIPHFDNEFRVERVVKNLGFPSYDDRAPGVFHG